MKQVALLCWLAIAFLQFDPTWQHMCTQYMREMRGSSLERKKHLILQKHNSPRCQRIWYETNGYPTGPPIFENLREDHPHAYPHWRFAENWTYLPCVRSIGKSCWWTRIGNTRCITRPLIPHGRRRLNTNAPYRHPAGGGYPAKRCFMIQFSGHKQFNSPTFRPFGPRPGEQRRRRNRRNQPGGGGGNGERGSLSLHSVQRMGHRPTEKPLPRPRSSDSFVAACMQREDVTQDNTTQVPSTPPPTTPPPNPNNVTMAGAKESAEEEVGTENIRHRARIKKAKQRRCEEKYNKYKERFS